MRQEEFTLFVTISRPRHQKPVHSSIPTHWPDATASEFHHVDGIAWHIQRRGRARGDAPTLLLVHGTGGGTHSWAGVTDALAPHYHLVNVDLPGHGFTHVPPTVEAAHNPYALPGMARALHHLLQQLAEQPAVAVGHSAGVSVLLRMALDGFIAPERLIGVCPALVAPPAWYVTLIAPVLAVVVESDAVAGTAARLAAGTRIIENMLGSTGSTLTDAQLTRYRELCSKPEHVHAAMTMMARWDLPSLFRDIGGLKTPLRCIAARGDRWIPLASLSRAVERIPGAVLQVEDGGHLLPEERPDVITRALLPERA